MSLDESRILIIDENPKHLETILPCYGYEVTCLKKANEAMSFLSNHQDYDLVLLDVSISKNAGWEILRQLKMNPFTYDIPIIIITSVSDTMKTVTALKSGVEDYVLKPFLLPNLLARIEIVLRRYKKGFDENIEIEPTILKKLTEIEQKVLLFIAQGDDNDSISQKLDIGTSEVQKHLNSIYKKLHVSNRTQAIILATNTSL